MVELETLRPEHALEMFEGLADRSGYRFLPGEPPASVAALRSVYERQVVGRSPDGAENWLNWVVRRQGRGAVGAVGEVRALVDTRNAASIGLLRRVGFQHSRTIAGSDDFKGSRSDENEYVLSRERWTGRDERDHCT